jgi:hypothetical protein
LKKYYIIGFILLIAFLLFVAAASAGADSEVVMGTIGFFGIVALLPLFLYVIIAETRHIEEDIEVEAFDEREQEVPVVAPVPLEQQHIEAYEATTPNQTERTKRDSARGIDKGFIEGIRVKQKDRSKSTKREPEPKAGLLDIPEKVEKIPVRDRTINEQPDKSQGSRLVDIPDRIEEKSEGEEEGEKQLISGLKGDKTQTKGDEEKESVEPEEEEKEIEPEKEE